jgi:hypothetical protein
MCLWIRHAVGPDRRGSEPRDNDRRPRCERSVPDFAAVQFFHEDYGAIEFRARFDHLEGSSAESTLPYRTGFNSAIAIALSNSLYRIPYESIAL